MGQLDQLERRAEAILFASGDPMEGTKLAEILSVEEGTIIGLVNRIRDRYIEQESPINIITMDGYFQMTTYPEFARDIRAALEVRQGASLSQAALEVLAVIAYNQPVTRAFVEQVRGVDCSSHMRNLTEKGLIAESGRMNIPGNPIIYETTQNFLRCFGLNSISELPTLPDSAPTDEDQLEGQTDLF